jgi:predicted permease
MTVAPGTWLEPLLHEIRRAPRRLFRHPAFWLPAVATLALGVGAAVAVFATLDAVVLRPLPYPEPGRLVRLQSAVPETGGPAWGLGKSEFLYFQRSTRSFQALGLYLIDRSTVGARPAAGEPAQQVYVAAVSAGLARTLEVHPRLGREMRAQDNRAGAPPAVWLSHGFWARSFGRDPGVVGRVLPLDGRPAQVAGVLPPEARLPEELQGLDIRVDLWTPLRLDPADPPAASHRFRALGRLRPDVSRAAAGAELSQLTARLPAVLPATYTPGFLRKTGFSTELLSLRDDVLGGEARTLWIVLAAVILLLVVANANVANLVLAQAETDHPELALRAALGATRRRLAMHTFAEAWPLVLLVAAAAAFVAYGAVRLLLAFPPAEMPRLAEIRLGGRELALTFALSGLGGAVYTLLPLARRNLGSELLGASCCRVATITRRQRATRDAIVVAQVALSLVLVAGAVLLCRSFHRLSRVEPGFTAHDALTFHVVLPRSRYDSLQSATSFYRRLAARTASLHGVGVAGLTSALPLTGFDGCSSVYLAEKPLTAGEQPPCVPVFLVSPGYFQALGIRLRGNAPEWADLEERAPLAVVSEALARRLWRGREPVGLGIRTSPTGVPYRVVGVADDIRANGLDQPPVEALYLPLIPAVGVEGPAPLDMAVVARTTERPSRVAAAVQRAVLDLDPEVPVTEVRPLREILRRSMARASFSTLLLGLCSGMAIAFAALGIYSLLTFLIARRQREIGIRMALGAGRLQAGGLIVRQSLLLAALGVVLGLVGAFFSMQYLQSLLFEVDPADPLTLGCAALLLLAISAAASWLPAWRAAHVEPHVALHQA